MPDIEIKRGYEDLPDKNIRFGIRVINNSDSAISDVEVLLDYTESLFELSSNRIQKLGTIPPTILRTAKFILKPLSCIHKENIGATVIYKDHQWKKHTLEMRPKEVHCVGPFLKEKPIKRSDFLLLSKSGYFEERGVNFEGITVDRLVDFLSHTCEKRLYKVDKFPIENGKILYLAGDAIGEKAYYLLTAVLKEYEGLAQVLLRANSDKQYGLNGFLSEILDNLRHLVVSASAREIGVIRKEQVVNIIDKSTKIWGDVGMFKDESTSFVSNDNQSERIATVDNSTKIVGDVGMFKDGSTSFVSNNNQSERTATVEKYSKIGMEEEKKRREEERRRRQRESEETEKKEREEHERIQKSADDIEALRHRREALKLKREKIEKKKLDEEQEIKRRREIEEEHEKLRLQIIEEEARLRKLQEEERKKENWKNIWDISKQIISVKTTRREKSRKEIENNGFLGFGKKKELVDVFVEKETDNQIELRENAIGMKFALIPAGEFMMGSEEFEWAKPVHRVKISKPFYLGIYPVIQREWKEVMGSNPSNFKGDNLPVETVSWNDVQDFIKKLNEKEGGNKYRLPTEAEWEYAACAGTTTRYSFGDDKSKLGDYAWYDSNSGSKTHDVGQKKPNPWGLYDMHGNVWEWVQDIYHNSYSGAPIDGSAWEGTGSDRVVRGGGWSYFARGCRSAIRNGHAPSAATTSGFAS